MTEKPVSITGFKAQDKAADALHRVSVVAQETGACTADVLRERAKKNRDESGYGVVEIVLLVVVVVLALVGIYYLAANH